VSASPGERYSRQTRLAVVGSEGQARLAAATCAVVGVGATGGVAAVALCRAGVGTLRVVDRDVCELSNLQRQILFTDQDAREAAPKAEAARRALRAANPEVRVEAFARDLDHRSIDALLEGVDCVVDGTDSFETRLLVNDWCVREGVPWIYVGVVGVTGQSLTILPGEGPCFACYVPEPPPAGATETCETAGVLGPAVLAVASFGATEALKLCMGRPEETRRGLLLLDAWRQEVRTVGLERDPECRCCCRREFPWLDGRGAREAVRLCGRAAVLVSPPGGAADLDLSLLGARLGDLDGVRVDRSDLALRVSNGSLEATVFADGRAIVRGTDDLGRARSFWSRYIGS